MSFINKVSSAISRAINALKELLTRTNTIAAKYGPQLREFVINTADQLEQAIPDSGMGNVKLAMFDGALRVFVQVMREEENIPDEEMAGIFQFAHFILEGYLATKKAKESVK